MMRRALLAHQKASTDTKSPADEDKDKGTVVVHFYCSSGGNAGLACATAAAALSRGGAPCTCTIVVPLTAPAHQIAKLRLLGATVHQVGSDWSGADKFLRTELLARDDPKAAIYVPPFDHPHVWEGAASIVDEVVAQTAGSLLAAASRSGSGSGNTGNHSGKIDGIVCSVGGGGLLSGIMEGVERLKDKPRVLAIETLGADSLNQSVRAGELVTLPAITSVATSLGAVRVAEQAFEWTRSAAHLTSHVVSDADAVAGSVRFANDALMLVEVACGAAVAPVYNGDLRRVLGAGLRDEEWAGKNVVLIVCGGSNVTLEMLRAYQERFGVV